MSFVKTSPPYPTVALCVYAAANEVGAIVDKRIHNLGKASDNSPLGKYSIAYARKRKNRKPALQVDYIDLEVTGRLRKSHTVGVNEKGNIVIGFDEPYQLGNYSLISIVENRWKDKGGVHYLNSAEIRHAQESLGKLLAQWRNNYFTQ